MDAAKLVDEEEQTILRNHFERIFFSEMQKCKSEAVKDTSHVILRGAGVVAAKIDKKK